MPTLSVIIPALNAAAALGGCLDALGDVGEVIVADGGSGDGTQSVARRRGARVIEGPRGRGIQLAAAATHATSSWLLFLHADTILQVGWRGEVAAFTADPANARRAAVFRFALDDGSAPARRLERMVAWRCRMLALPYGDQGLLISRAFYDEIGGFKPLPLMEDVDIVRRIGRRRLAHLETAAVTSAVRWRRDGWTRRSVRNLGCLTLYSLGVPPHTLVKVYGG